MFSVFALAPSYQDAGRESSRAAITAAAVHLVEAHPDQATSIANAGDLLLAGGWYVTSEALVFPDGAVMLRGGFTGTCTCAEGLAGGACVHVWAARIVQGLGTDQGGAANEAP